MAPSRQAQPPPVPLPPPGRPLRMAGHRLATHGGHCRRLGGGASCLSSDDAGGAIPSTAFDASGATSTPAARHPSSAPVSVPPPAIASRHPLLHDLHPVPDTQSFDLLG